MAQTKKKIVKEEPKVFGCPHCGNTKGFTELNTVMVDYPFEKFEGVEAPVEYGAAKVCWDTAEPIEKERFEPFTCSACGYHFKKAVCLSDLNAKDRGHAG